MPRGQAQGRRSGATAARSASAGRPQPAGDRRPRPTTSPCDDGDRDLLTGSAKSGCPPNRFVAVASEMKRTTNGVAMPSLSPLSTLRNVRMRRDSRVRDDRQSQGGVSRSQDRTDEQRGRDRKLGKDEPGDKPASGDRQEEPDPEESTDQAGVAAEPARSTVEASVNRTRARVSSASCRIVDDSRSIWSKPSTSGPRTGRGATKNTAGPIDVLVESVGDERVARQEQDEHRDPRFRGPPPMHPARPTLGTLLPTVTAASLVR